jgi:surface antigen
MKGYSQGCDTKQNFQDKSVADFPSGINGVTDWETFGVFDNTQPGCDNCNTPYINPDSGCQTQGTNPGGYGKSQCTAWAYFRTGYAGYGIGTGSGGFWAENLPNCPENITKETVCRSKTPARGALMSIIGERDDQGRVSDAGHIAVIECAYQVNDVWHLQISEYNVTECQFSARERILGTDYNPDDLWFIHRYNNNGEPIPLPGSCGQSPEIKYALVTPNVDTPSTVEVNISLNGSVCPETDHYILHKKVFRIGESNHYHYEFERIERRDLFNFTHDELINLEPCSRIVFQLEQVIAGAPNISAWSEERTAINLSTPENFSKDITNPGDYSDVRKIDWDDVCPGYPGTNYIFECNCSNPQGSHHERTIPNSEFSGYFYKSTQYQCTITAINDGDKSITKIFSFQTEGENIPLPAAPTIEQGENYCNDLVVSWEPIEYSSAFHYEVNIYYKPNNSTDFVLVKTDEVVSTLSTYSWSANRGDGLYGATIKVVEDPSGGNDPVSSDESSMAEISIDCINEIPNIQSITTEFCQGVTLEWGYNHARTVENIESFEVYRGDEKISPDNFRSTSFTDIHAENNKWTTYRIRANYSNNGYQTDRNAVSYPRSIRTQTPPPAPELVSYESHGKELEISFKNVTDVDSFLVTKNPHGGQFLPSKYILSHSSNNDVSFNDIVSLKSNCLYRYQFKSVKDGCLSSDGTPFHSIHVLRKPLSLEIDNISGTALTLAWNTAAYSPEGTRFEIEKKLAGEPISSYVQVGTGNYSDQTWTDNTYNSSALYQYRLRAKYSTSHGTSYSTWTDPVTSIEINCTGISAPVAPTLNHAGTNAGIMEADWTDNDETNTVDGFIIDFKDNRDASDEFSIANVYEGNVSEATYDFTDYKGKVLDIRVRSYVNHPSNGVCPSNQSNRKLIYPLFDPYGGKAEFLSNGNIYINWLNPNWIWGYFDGQYNHTGNPDDPWFDLNLPKTENIKQKFHTSPTEDECAFFYRIKHKTIEDNDSSNWYYIEEPALRDGCVIGDLEIIGDGTVTFCPWDDLPSITLTAIVRNFVNPIITWLPGNNNSTTLNVGQSGRITVVVEEQSDDPVPTMSMKKENTVRQSDESVKKKTASAWCWFIPRMCSRDPNEVIGPAGYGEPKYIAKEPVLPYQILFENDPDFALVPAQKVTITQPVDENADLTSFRLGDFGFRNFTFKIPENRTFYSARLDLTDTIDLLVDVVAGIDIDKREVFWRFNSIDPETGLVPTDVYKGFLAVNDSLHRGEGFVNYTIHSSNNVITNDSIKAQATIVFDDNESIITNEAFNTFDTENPTSKITSDLLFADQKVDLKLSGNDSGSGIASYDVYVSVNDGPYNIWQLNILDSVVTFEGLTGNTYDLYSLSTDNVGNHEPDKKTPDIRFIIPEPTCLTSVSSDSLVNGLTYNYYEKTGTSMPDFDTMDVKSFGHVKNIDAMTHSSSDNYGFVFNGLLNTPETGNYSISVNSSNASELLIFLNDTLVIPSNMNTICLLQGLHPLEVRYFGKDDFEFSWSIQSEWITKQPVPDSMLYYSNTSPTDITITSDSIQEKMPLNTAIGEFVTTDAEGGPFAYELKDTLDHQSFAIHENVLLSNESFNYNIKNEYHIIVTSADDAGYSLEKKLLIKVYPEDSIPSAIAGTNMPERNMHWPNHPEQWVNIFPVPVNEANLNVEYFKPENGKVKIKIQSVNGTLIKNYSFKKTSLVFSENINFSEFPEGFYMLEIHQGDEVFKQTIIK